MDRELMFALFSFSMLLYIMLVGRDVSVGWIGNWEGQSQAGFAGAEAFLKHIDNCVLGWLQINDSKLGVVDW